MTGPEHPRERRERLYEIIFEADTPSGKAFDVLLLFLILLSVSVIMLESVADYAARYGKVFYTLEWVFTGLFTLEYLLRLFCVRQPWRYGLSFFGIVDLLAILPTYLSLVVSGATPLVVVRLLRLLRVFRVFKLVRYVGEANVLAQALRGSLPKLTVFLVAVLILITIVGTSMYLVEGSQNEQFRNIPSAIYWAIVTVTTVGYGDITPATVPGRFLASVLMISGFAIIAVPTGIVAAEVYHHRKPTTQVCPECLAEGHDVDAVYCKYCGAKI